MGGLLRRTGMARGVTVSRNMGGMVMTKSDLLYKIYTAGADLRNTSAQSPKFPDVLTAFDRALSEFEEFIRNPAGERDVEIVFRSSHSVWIIDHDIARAHMYDLASAWTLHHARYVGTRKL